MSRAYPQPAQTTPFGLLPEPEGRFGSFFISTVINGILLAVLLLLSIYARHTILERRQEQMVLLAPQSPPPPPKPQVKPPAPTLPPPPKPQTIRFEAPRITAPRVEPKPAPKPLEIEARPERLPVVKESRPTVVLQPQPKSAISSVAAESATAPAKAATAPVRLGSLQGVAPNPNAMRTATVAALGNPNGAVNGSASTAHGVVGKVAAAGIPSSSATQSANIGKVASVGVPTASAAQGANMGRVAAANIPTAIAAPQPGMSVKAAPVATSIEVLSKPPVRYTAEARQLHIEGDVVLRVTFTANGQVVVLGVVHGLGHGLDDEARRVAQQIRFRPATHNGQPVDATTSITITFQLG